MSSANSSSERIVTLRLPHGQMCTLHRALLWTSASLTEAGRYMPVGAADTVDVLDEIRKAFVPAFDDAALGREVTDEMVERAAMVLYHHPTGGWGRSQRRARDGYRVRAREMLNAALALPDLLREGSALGGAGDE